MSTPDNVPSNSFVPTLGNDASLSSSRRNKSRSNKSKRSKAKEDTKTPLFKGATEDFGAVFTLKDETTDGRGNTYKEAVLAAEVWVAP